MCAAVGSWGALAGGRARLERIALETLGRSPQSNAAGGVAAGALVALVSGAALGTCTGLDLQGYYPTVIRGGDFAFDGHDFVDHTRGLRVAPDGTTATLPREEVPRAITGAGPDRRARNIAAAVTALTGIALALLAACIQNATPRARLRLAAVVLLAALSTILAFHASAAGGPLAGPASSGAVLPACALLAYAAAQYKKNPGESARAP